MEVEAILGFVLLVCFVLALFIVLTARIASARRNRAKRKEKAEELVMLGIRLRDGIPVPAQVGAGVVASGNGLRVGADGGGGVRGGNCGGHGTS